ncbi:MAG: shikimate dehydrogenase [Fulvimarina manganoxydans]|uniref:shikimate dehydrogenase n=1 Tax=Fulvimarina manganoxydans TaxID=937218 RepID=UPI0023550B1B|nr:shikimate dehydrogenase [Fulvimarina manganoxydans]MCK5934460.1 shikimate dehydrogenase [Fulvimarina manganoxydans]
MADQKTIAERDAEWEPKPYVSGEARPRGEGSVFDPNAKRASETGPKAFVTGWPVWHSRSPLIHGNWLKTYGLAGSYSRVGVPPEEIDDFLRGLKAAGYVGGNVTIPHKERAFAVVDQRDAAAEAIGAVNTLWFEGERLVGGNTDAFGFAKNLDERLSGWADAEHAVVLGAGGAARAVIFALIDRGVAHVSVVNRTLSRAEALAEMFGSAVSAHSEAEREALLSNADLLVNTAPVPERNPDDDKVRRMFHVKPSVNLSMMRSDSLVTDIVYSPLMTPTLNGAEATGLRFCDGLGMLLHQAVPGFERWFGQRPEVTETLRALILKDLGLAE